MEHDPAAENLERKCNKTYTAYVEYHGCSAFFSQSHQVHGIYEETQPFVSGVSVVNPVDFLVALARDLNDHCVDSHGHSLPEKMINTFRYLKSYQLSEYTHVTPGYVRGKMYQTTDPLFN